MESRLVENRKIRVALRQLGAHEIRRDIEHLVIRHAQGPRLVFECRDVRPPYARRPLQRIDVIEIAARTADRKSVGAGKSAAVRVDHGGGRSVKKKNDTTKDKNLR